MLHDNDHRRIAQRMELLHFQDEAPGMVFWHPAGFELYRQLEEAARRHLERSGYLEVCSPQLLRNAIWEASGHIGHFDANMFAFGEEGREAALKPVSCPGHIQIAEHHLESYRDLPLRLAEFGVVHRNERSGSLHGFFRLRQFSQDDGHVFCHPDDVIDEVARFCESLVDFYAAFGLDDYDVALSLRPEDRFGDDARWDRAERALADGLERAGVDYERHEGEGAFYGPKIEFLLEDHAGRAWQCGTIQLDFFMPERFDLSYAGPDDEPRRPAMLHRALYGSLERFMGLLLEHHAGQLPAWLAPIQARVIPIGDDHLAYAHDVRSALADAAVRVELSEPVDSVGRRIADAHERGVPFMLVVGDREVEAECVALRDRDGQQVLPLAEAVRRVAEEVSPPC
jgi:threonyl-tRNA synthetase